MPSFEAKCVDDDGNTVPPGETGELWVRGAAVIKGYINRPEATAASITDGWLHTGDIARIDDDGFIFIVDRKKDMVLRGGENVYCAEVEAAALSPSRRRRMLRLWGCRRTAGRRSRRRACCSSPARAVTDAELRAHCGDLIASYKVPRYVWFRPNRCRATPAASS